MTPSETVPNWRRGEWGSGEHLLSCHIKKNTSLLRKLLFKLVDGCTKQKTRFTKETNTKKGVMLVYKYARLL